MSRILEERVAYKPLLYPWAYDSYKEQHQAHWLPEEINFEDDIQDWNKALTDAERDFLTNILRFFTQGDVSVAEAYTKKFLPVFKHPELVMMMSSIASCEAIHIDAYSQVIDTIGMPETLYSSFTEIKEMKDKYDYITEQKSFVLPDGSIDIPELAKQIAIYAAFTEGMHLFSSFVMLLNFPRMNKMKGMGQVITWSIRDETIHFESMIKLFRTIIKENPSIWTDDFKAELYQMARDMVKLEDNFIDIAFSSGGIINLTADEVKNYIRFIADRRLLQLGLKPNYNVTTHSLDWYADLVNAVEHTNFFENRVTEYSKGTLTGDWYA